MAYDAANGTVVLFGGGSGYDDTWTWDGTNWSEQHPAESPPPTYAGSMAYDAATGDVVLFGGFTTPQPDNQTWIWDGTTWTQANPATSPIARIDGSMAFDPVTDNLVLFGGYQNAPNGDLEDTWTWDGSNWTQVLPKTNNPAPRFSASMAFDAATGDFVLFGGTSQSALFGDTWSWDGTDWMPLSPTTSPSPRYEAMMDYDPNSQGLLLFGGTQYGSSKTYFNDTWDFTADSVPPANTPEVPFTLALPILAAGGIGVAVWLRRRTAIASHE